jgi:hypothetical protein
VISRGQGRRNMIRSTVPLAFFADSGEWGKLPRNRLTEKVCHGLLVANQNNPLFSTRAPVSLASIWAGIVPTLPIA